MMRTRFLAVTLPALLAGCGTMNNYISDKTTTTEYYRVFEVRTNAAPAAVAKAASNDLGRNIDSVQEATPLPASSAVPEKPGRFKLINIFEDSAVLRLRVGGVGMHTTDCDVWSVASKNGDLR